MLKFGDFRVSTEYADTYFSGSALTQKFAGRIVIGVFNKKSGLNKGSRPL